MARTKLSDKVPFPLIRRATTKPRVMAAAIFGLGVWAATVGWGVSVETVWQAAPYPEPAALTVVVPNYPSGDHLTVNRIQADYMASVPTSPFSTVGYFAPASPLYMANSPERQVTVLEVSPAFFSTLGLPMAKGTDFANSDFAKGTFPACIISHGLWLALGSPNITGRTTSLGAKLFLVRGVAPRELGIVSAHDVIYEPWARTPASADDSTVMIGRLRHGLRLGAARAWLASPQQRLHLRAAAPATPDLQVMSLADWVLGPVQHWTNLLLAVTLMVLLLAGTTAAVLLVSDSLHHRAEHAIRLALGASNVRMLANSMLGCTVPLLAGSAAALALSPLGVSLARRLEQLRPSAGLWTFHAWNLRLDSGHLLIAVAAAILLSGAAALAPAMSLLGLDPAEVMTLSGPASSQAGLNRTMRWGLAAIEIASSTLLCCLAAVFALSLNNQVGRSLGFNPTDVMTIHLAHNPPPDELRNAIERIRGFPGLLSVSATAQPFGSPYPEATRAGYQMNSGTWAESPTLLCDTVSPGFFKTLRVPLIEGREFRETDTGHAVGVVVVNQTLATILWPDADPLGRRFDLNWPSSHSAIFTVVGVVPAFRNSLEAFMEAAPKIYFPYAQLPGYASEGSLALLLRFAAGDGPSPVTLDRQLGAVAPRLEIRAINSIADAVEADATLPKLRCDLLECLAAIVFIVGIGGIYATVSSEMSKRRREFAIRAALGAGAQAQLSRALLQPALATATGAVIGLSAALYALTLTTNDLYPGRYATWTICSSTALACAISAVICATATVLPALYAPPIRQLNTT